MNEYLQQPTTYDAEVLVIARIHRDEEKAEQLRAALLEQQPQGVAVVDGFSPEDVPAGQRCLNNLPPYDNLNMQFGKEPSLGVSPPTDKELETLTRTRRRAGELLDI